MCDRDLDSNSEMVKTKVLDRINKKASNIKLLILDVDGVLTDGRLGYCDDGSEMKFFDVRDGHGIKLLMRAGIEVAIISGRYSKAVEHRASDLGIKIVFQKALVKIEAFEEILKMKNLEDHQVCVVGDDLPDLPLIRRCGLSFSVPQGVEDIKRDVDCITANDGGRGAVRQVCEMLLKSQGLWEKVTSRYFNE